MIFQLKEIQGFLQELIDTVSALINAELIIVDVNLIVLAGTKKYHHLIGERAIPYIYNALFNRKDIIVIENPMEHEICSDCKEREACSEFAGINTPLFVDGEVIGGLSIAALNPEQKRYLIEYKKNYIDFSRKMVDLIQSKIKSYTLTKELDFTTRMFNSIINNSNQGIVLIDNSNRIRVVNDYFCEMFNIHSDDVVGKPFEEVYRNEFIRNMVYQGKEFDTIEASVSVSEKNFRVVHSGRHIRIDENLNGFLLFLKDIKSVSYMLNSLMVNKEDITFDEIVGESAELHQVKKKALSVSNSNSTILIQGESGTGKELFARAIHNASTRKNNPFITINCGAIPENLIESELFGYEGGAFSGAKSQGKPGKFELASGGTLFLDEIGDMPLHLQVKLLRVIEEKAVTRLGGVEEIKIDVRIIAATNKDLEKMVGDKEFRDDLYYRLNVIPLKIPSLRERGKDDVKVLTRFFIEKYSRTLNKTIKSISDDGIALLEEYQWPGNVRELENAIEYGINVDTDGVITAEDLPRKFKNVYSESALISSIDELTIREINKALDYYGHTVEGKKEAAKALGIGIATLYRWINK